MKRNGAEEKRTNQIRSQDTRTEDEASSANLNNLRCGSMVVAVLCTFLTQLPLLHLPHILVTLTRVVQVKMR